MSVSLYYRAPKNLYSRNSFRRADGYGSRSRDGHVADPAAASSDDDAFYATATAGYDPSYPHAGSDLPGRAWSSQHLDGRCYSPQE